MNINTTKNINTKALIELARYLNISDDELNRHINDTHKKFMKYEKQRISDVLSHITNGVNMDDFMFGAIMGIYTSDYIFSLYFKGDINAD